MTTSVDALRIRSSLGRHRFKAPVPFGPDGWTLTAPDGRTSVIVTVAEHDGAEWVHASIAHGSYLPSYEELKQLHNAVFRDGWSYQIFAPLSDHVNIHEYALHLWGRLDGNPGLPNFTNGRASI